MTHRAPPLRGQRRKGTVRAGVADPSCAMPGWPQRKADGLE